MFSRVLPKQIDNAYRGHPLALWLLGALAVLHFIMSINSILNTRAIATGDGFALDSYGGAGADAVLLLFAMVSLAHLVMALLTVIVLARYRAMVPLMYVLLLADQVGRRVLVALNPVERTGDSAVALYINLGLLAVLLLGLVLSLRARKPSGKIAEGFR